MCIYDVKWVENIGFVARDYANCGTCPNRDWCPIYLVAVKNEIERLEKLSSDSKPALKFAKAAYEYNKDPQRKYALEGAINVLEHKDAKVKPVSTQEGILFLRNMLHDKKRILDIQKLIKSMEVSYD